MLVGTLSPQIAERFVLLLGVTWTLILLSTVRPDVFYSCDGGVKFLLTQQLAAGAADSSPVVAAGAEVEPSSPSGRRRFDLDPPAEPWVRALWDDGLFPIGEPFVYRERGTRRDVRVLGLPVFFPVLSAPACAALGWRGLYLIPLVSTWLTWVAFARLCRLADLDGAWRVAALAAVIFAAPLTLYSAMFWEHAPAWALGVVGLCGLFEPRRPDSIPDGSGRPRDHAAAAHFMLCGIALSLAGWLRPEMMVLAVLAAALAAAWPMPAPALCATGLAAEPAGAHRSNPSDRPPRRGVGRLFAAAVATGLLGWFAWNYAASGAPLGLHGRQIATIPTARLELSLAILGLQHAGLAGFFPLVLLPAGAAIGAWLLGPRAAWLTRRDARLLALGVAFLLFMPFVFPHDGGKQWGPRFVYPVVPVAALLAARAAQAAARRGPGARLAMTGAFAALALAGAQVNMWQGYVDLRDDYRLRILPALHAIRAAPQDAVATDTHFASMEFTATFDRKRWFLTPDAASMGKLCDALVGNGRREFLYVVRTGQPVPPELPLTLSHGPAVVEFGDRRECGASDVWTARIR